MHNNRLALLRERMQELDVDTFLVTQAENRRYISGFTGSAGVAIVTGDRALLATDFRYWQQVQLHSPDFELVKVQRRFEELLPHLLEDLRAKRIAFEGDELSYDAYMTYHSVIPTGMTLVSTKDVVRWLRAVKDASELDSLKQAIARTDKALENVKASLVPGMTEREVAWKLEREMRENGAGPASFDLIVAAGPSGAMAHARATDRPIQVGEPIVIDMGCKWDGYCSDLTRTLIIGDPDARFTEIYDTVLKAQLEAEAEIQPGMSGKEAHAIAADVITQAGYGELFGHGLGHGVGLAVHELPVLGGLSDHTLRPDMVFSVEPGIYLPDWGGVRIEDLVLLSENGIEVLSRADKNPKVPLR